MTLNSGALTIAVVMMASVCSAGFVGSYSRVAPDPVTSSAVPTFRSKLPVVIWNAKVVRFNDPATAGSVSVGLSAALIERPGKSLAEFEEKWNVPVKPAGVDSVPVEKYTFENPTVGALTDRKVPIEKPGT